MGFAAESAVVEGEGGLSAEISDKWEIWGPNGGYLAAIALRAAGLRCGGGHRPAGISCQYLARGLSGGAGLRVETLRAGRNAACLAVEMVQDGRRTLSAQVWIVDAPPGPGPVYCDLRMPDVPPPEDLDPPPAAAVAMPFWRNFDLRMASPARAGHPDPRGARMDRWIRFRDFAPTDDPFLAQARALLLIDTMLFPAHWSRSATQLDYLAPSLDVSVWFQEDSRDADWLLVEAAAPHASEGLIHGCGRVWTRDGRLVASGGSNLLVLPARKPG